MQSKFKSKILSVLLTLAMVFAMLPLTTIPAFAATGMLYIGPTQYYNLNSNAGGGGWTWTAATNTLTLTGSYFGAAIDIVCGTNDTINLEYTGDVTIVANDGIRCNGNLNVYGSGGTLTLNGSSTDDGIVVTGDLLINGGTVTSSQFRDTIRAGGDVEVNGGAVYNAAAAAGSAIRAAGDVTVSGGMVSAAGATGFAVHAAGNVNVSGGTVSAAGSTGFAVHADGDVNVSGGTVSATGDNGRAINAVNASTAVTVSGGFVFAYGTAISNAVYINGSSFSGPTANGIVAAWNSSGGPYYAEGSSSDLTVLPTGAAIWHSDTTLGDGISYANGANTGFFPVSGVTVGSGDIIPPVLTAGTINRTSDTAAAIGFTADEAGTAYYLVLASGATAPTSAAVKAGTSLGATTVGANSGKTVTLTAGARDIYVVVEDAAGNISAPLKIEAAAYVPIDTTPPTLTAGNVSRKSDTAAAIGFTADEAGTAYYLVLASGAAAPASAAVKAGTSLGATTVDANSGKTVTLTAGARDIYVVVEDAVGNISAPLKIEAAAYVPDTTKPTPGGGGVITTANITDNSLTLIWSKATDNITEQSDLKYYVYQQESVSFGLSGGLPTNGTLLNTSGTADISEYNISSLSANTVYFFMVVVEDEAGNKAPYPDINEATSPDATLPTLSSGTVSRTSDTAATIGFTADEAGTAYYLVLASGATAPTSAAVKAGTSLGATTVGANSGKAVTLTAGARDIYVVVEDAAGNISAPLKIEAAAYSPGGGNIAIDATNFPDANFRGWLQNSANIGGAGSDSILTTSEISTIIDIDVSGENITSLTGIEHFTALTYLGCSYNQLTSLDVSGLTELSDLSCSYNQLTSLDVSGLSSLNSLSCSGNRLTDLGTLPAGLTYLDCDFNELTDLGALPAGLNYLSCSENQLTDLGALPAGLNYLSCSYNRLTSLGTLPAGLTRLECHYNQLTSLGTLPAGLTRLECHNNQLTSLGTLPVTLTYLICSYNQLTSLDVSGLSALFSLNCSQNRLTGLALSGSAGYSYINVRYNYMAGESAVDKNGQTIAWGSGSFYFSPQHASDFKAVTNITGVPSIATVNIPLTLSGTVIPADADNSTIVWSVYNAGSTGATINGGVFTATSAGTATVMATIAGGAAASWDYTNEFDITVTAGGAAQLTQPTGVAVTNAGAVSWNAVPNAASYTIKVYKGAGSTALVTLTGKTGTSYTLTNADIAALTAAGTDYCVAVTAIGNGTTYTDSAESVKSSGTFMNVFSAALTTSGYAAGDTVSFNGAAVTTNTTTTVYAISGTTVAFSAAAGSGRTVTITGDVTASGNITNITANKAFTATFAAAGGGNIAIDATNFPDANFRGWLQNSANIGGAGNDSILTPAEIATIISIDVSINNIASLTGIEHFTALITLDCRENRLTDLGALPAGLTYLSCSYNQLTSLDVSGLSSLDSLYCSENRLTDLGALPTGLNYLYCYSNRLTSLGTLPAGLIELDCSSNQLASLGALPTGLDYLNCSENRLTDLGALPTGLNYLYCSNNQLASLDVSGLEELTSLYCPQNRLTGLALNGSASYSNINVRYNYMAGVGDVTGQIITWDDSSLIFSPQHAAGFKAVTNITGVPSAAAVSIPLTLSGTVIPSDATNQTIVWSVGYAGGTGATISNGDQFTATAAGTATVMATIAGGAATDIPYLKPFYVTVTAGSSTDTTPPVPGNSGTITTASVAQTTLTLNWAKTTDSVSAQSALKYYVYRSASNNIATAANCASNGTLLNAGGTADIATLNVAGLTANTTYYFNVVVEDEAGNKAAYTPVSATTTAVPPVITIYTEPAATTNVTYGGISGSLTVAASATQGAGLYYQWYSNTTNSATGGTLIPAADYSFFVIPTTLDAGTYYYFCEVSAYNAASVRSTVATVTVAKGTYTGIMTASKEVPCDTAASGIAITLPVLPAGASYPATGTVGGAVSALINSQSISGTMLIIGVTSQANGTAATITIPVANAANYNSYNVVVTITAQNTPQESTPTATIDYTAEKLIGLVPSAAYTVNAADRAADGSGNIAIEATWFNSTISIVKTGVTPYIDSTAQSLSIPARPVAPNGAGKTDTTGGNSNGTITGVDSTMEYKLSAASTWTAIGGTSVTGLAAGTYNVRYKATVGAFASAATANLVIASSSSGNTGGGGGSSGGSYTPPASNVTTDKQPNMPLLAKQTVTGTVKDSVLSATITQIMATNAVNATGDKKDGLAAVFNLNASGNYDSYSITVNRAALEALKTAGVKYVQFTSAVMDITLDLKAIEAVLSQTAGNVTISAIKETKQSDSAKAVIGSRPYYDVTIKGANGAVVSDLKGGTATLAIAYKPSTGEQTGNLYGVYVDKNGKANLLTNSSYDNGRMIFNRSTLSLYGVGYNTPAPAFTDTAGHWAKDDIDFVASRELIGSTASNVFAPDVPVTRAVFLMALGKLSGADVSGYTVSSFTDVSGADPAMPYIEWAVKNNIVSGVGDNRFAPGYNITREQIAVMMVNYTKATNYTLPVSRQLNVFADNAIIADWAKDAVKSIQQTGIIVGKTNNLFDPQGNATRAESSTILRRFIELVIDEGTSRGWVQNDSGQWQYINTNGKAVTGWQTIGEQKYFFDHNGAMKTGRYTENGKTYYLDPANGVMAAGKWVETGGKWYYFNSDGSMAVSTTIEGYEVGADGARK